MKQSENVKIQVYCPRDAADAVRLAIGEAGGGHIGNYSHCVSVFEGHGYFKPLAGSNPTIGTQGKIEKVAEVKLEFICEQKNVKAVVTAIKKVHPYEETAIDILPLLTLEE